MNQLCVITSFIDEEEAITCINKAANWVIIANKKVKLIKIMLNKK